MSGRDPNHPSRGPTAAQEDPRVDALGVFATISGHRKRGLASGSGGLGGEQQVALRPTRTEPESTVRCVLREPRGALSTIEGARYRDNYLPGPREPFKRYTAYLATEATEKTGGVFSQ